MAKHHIAFTFLLSLLFPALDTVGEDWPRFRGTGGAGVSRSTTIPISFDASNYRWQAELPGAGNSSPIIIGDRLYITSASESTRTLQCFDKATGQQQWAKQFDFASYKMHKNNSFASSTPAADELGVYSLWHSKQATTLVAHSHDGQERWRYELGPYLHGQGGASSPITAGDYVIVAHDHKSDSFLLAVDRATGKPHWKIPRAGKRACYSTPLARNYGDGGVEIVFTHCYEGVIGVDLATGQQRWHIDPFGRSSQRALVSAISAGDLIVTGSGAAGGERQIVAIKVSDGLPAEATEAYRLLRQSPHVPTPVYHGERLYFWNDGGIATCSDASSGDTIWQKRVGGNYFASPILIGDRLFSIDTRGEVVVIAASDDFEIIARNPMGQESRASLAVSDEVLYVRTDSRLVAIGKD